MRPFGYGPVPPGWKQTKLRGTLARRKEFGQPGLPLLSVNLPSGVVVRQTGDGRQAPSEDLSGYQVVHEGDLVMNQLGKPHGALGVSPMEGIISPAYFVAAIGPGVCPTFLHYLLRTHLYISEYERRGKFMPPNQFDISWDQFRDIDLVLPPIDQQRDIAGYLDGEVARLDNLVLKKEQLIGAVEERFRTTVYWACTQGVRGGRDQRQTNLDWAPSIPADWGTPTVSTNFSLMLGKMLNPEATDGGEQYHYLRNVNVKWGRFDLEDLPTMTFTAADRQRCGLLPGDVLICEGGEVGRAAVWNGELQDCYFQKAIHRARPVGQANGRYLMYALMAAARQNVFNVEGNLSTIVHLTGEQLSAHRFPWPPLEEQAEIVSHLDGQWQTSSTLAEKLDRQIELLREHRQALITAAVTGELEIPGVAA